MMKKKLTILVIGMAAAVLLLSGCGKMARAIIESRNADMDSKEQEMQEELAEMREELLKLNPPERPEIPEFEMPETMEPEGSEEPEDSVQPVRGTLENGMFTNEVFHISFPVSDDMLVFTDEQIMQIIGMGTEVMEEAGIHYSAEQMEQAMQGTIYDTVIMMPDGASNVMVLYENLDVTAQGMRFTEKQYLQIVIARISKMLGEESIVHEQETITIGGKDYTKVEVETGQGYSQTYYIRNQENYMVGFLYTCVDGAEAAREEFFNSFVEVE